MELMIKEIDSEYLNDNLVDYWVGFGIGSAFVFASYAVLT